MARIAETCRGRIGKVTTKVTPYTAAMKTILVPVDFSPVTKRVIAEAAALARGTGGHLVFIHVVQPPVIVTDYAGMTLEDTEQLMVDARRWGARRLVRLRARLRGKRIQADAMLESGAPVSCILAGARKLKASHIVIGSHGHSAFYDLLIGSTARGILKQAECPVVVVPARLEKAARASRKMLAAVR